MGYMLVNIPYMEQMVFFAEYPMKMDDDWGDLILFFFFCFGISRMDGLFHGKCQKWMMSGGTPMTKRKAPHIGFLIIPSDSYFSQGWLNHHRFVTLFGKGILNVDLAVAREPNHGMGYWDAGDLSASSLNCNQVVRPTYMLGPG